MTDFNTRKTIVIILFFTLLFAAVYSGLYVKNKIFHTEPHQKITIAYPASPNSILLYIAQANGYFAEEGLEAILQPYPFGRPALQAMMEGKADIAISGDTSIVFAVMNGAKIVILATTQTSNQNEGIVARRDRGISSPPDLKGKRIGFTKETTGDFFLYSFLLAHGIESNQVKLVDMTPGKMSGALNEDNVDAVSTWNPTLTKLKQEQGDNAIVFYGHNIYTETFNVTTGRDFIRQHPETVKKVLKALIKAETFVNLYPEDARRVVSEIYGTDKTTLDALWSCCNIHVILDQALLVNLEDQSRWILKKGWGKRRDMPNYIDFIYTDGLASVKPSAVRIIR